MKIAKYIFLLILLFAIAMSVFVTTKDGSYKVVKSKLIEVPKSTAISYMADSKNWETINPWKDNLQKGIIKKQNVFDKDSISQFLLLGGNETKTTWIFSDSLKNTKVSWITNGKMSFTDKLLSLINRGEKNALDDDFEKGLFNLNRVLTTEVNTYNIKLDGFVERDTVFYIQRPVTCKKEQLPNKIKSILPKLEKLLLDTKTKTNGLPFIIYHSRDSLANTITFSVAVPTKQKIQISAESDIYSGQTNPFQAVKATLTGNYNHKAEALNQIFVFMSKNKLEQSPKHKEIEIISKNSTTNNSTSKWVTEILIPVRPIKPVFKKKPKVIAKDSTVVEEEPIME
ncbi:GyrI-like domain-containing protein [Flavobacterium sp.]|uniref:GyrI-like domain-containing protein n=1 Tax=Flavobacterium sp. TaxID=239 RepID=UPI00286E32C7|nr:GyrI-like domain-containing protein [Flavobacterium sp.]